MAASPPKESAEQIQERGFLQYYSGARAQYDVFVPYILSLIVACIGIRYSGVKLSQNEALAAMLPYNLASLLYSLTALTLLKRTGRRDRALANIRSGVYAEQCGGVIGRLARTAALRDCLLPSLTERSLRSVKRLPVYLRMGNG